MGQFLPSSIPAQPTEEITFQDLAELLSQASYVVALTGAGVSADSGIPTYRDPNDGLWQKYDMMDCASALGYWRRPHKLWQLIRDVANTSPEPNAAHIALKELEEIGVLKAIVTQNVDGLHQEAGSKEVVEFHGSLMQATCQRCGASTRLSKQLLLDSKFMATLPPACTRCKTGSLKPDATLFGESCPPAAVRAAQQHVDACDLLLVVGTGASVRPASDLPYRARRRQALVIEVNPATTELTDRISQKRIAAKASGLMDTVHILKSRMQQQQQPQRQQSSQRRQQQSSSSSQRRGRQ